MRCDICSAPTLEYHFGVMACRACAAFFRRYVNSPKQLKECNCETDRVPCRFCRMAQCLKAGMMTSKVQKKRDNNPCRLASCSVKTAPIALRNNDRITRALNNYRVLAEDRKIVHKTSPAKKINIFEYTTIAMDDSRIVWKFLERTFIELHSLRDSDKSNLFWNFFPKWTIFESATMATQRREVHTFFAPNGIPAENIAKFYKDCMAVDLRMNDAEVLKIFEPYWKSYYAQLTYPLLEFKFDQVECMAIITMMFLDPCYTNLSEECSEMCHELRKVIQKELKGYYLENNIPLDRLFKAIDVLLVMDKVDNWYQEQIQMWGVYNVSTDEQFRRLAITNKL